MDFRSRFSKRVRKSLELVGASLTKQAFRDECDVNNILAKYQKTGIIPFTRQGGHYGDFTMVEDYQTSLNKVMAAQESFLALPSTLRARFNNDPAEFVRFVQDSRNEDEIVALGLATLREDAVSKTEQSELPLGENQGGGASNKVKTSKKIAASQQESGE